MKSVIDYIRRKNEQFAASAIFHYLADPALPPEERLAFAPYMAHFVFSFMDINRLVLRDLASNSDWQRLVNIHTYEDADHWPWYLNDLKQLGLDKTLPLSEALYFVWGDHALASRRLTYDMIALIARATDKEKIMIVEAIEMTGNVFLRHTAEVCAQMPGGECLQYYSVHHYRRETGHHMGCSDIEEQLNGIVLDAAGRERGCALIDAVYALYQAFVDEMHRYATAHDIGQLRAQACYEAVITPDDPTEQERVAAAAKRG